MDDDELIMICFIIGRVFVEQAKANMYIYHVSLDARR